jgi:hypothetical protein
MGVLGKIGSGFKWFGKKLLGLIRKDETLLVVKLAAKYVPIPALGAIVDLVRYIDKDDVPGYEKMGTAIEKILPILEEYDVEIEEESDLRFIIELAVKIMKGKARAIEVE